MKQWAYAEWAQEGLIGGILNDLIERSMDRFRKEYRIGEIKVKRTAANAAMVYLFPNLSYLLFYITQNSISGPSPNPIDPNPIEPDIQNAPVSAI